MTQYNSVLIYQQLWSKSSVKGVLVLTELGQTVREQDQLLNYLVGSLNLYRKRLRFFLFLDYDISIDSIGCCIWNKPSVITAFQLYNFELFHSKILSAAVLRYIFFLCNHHIILRHEGVLDILFDHDIRIFRTTMNLSNDRLLTSKCQTVMVLLRHLFTICTIEFLFSANVKTKIKCANIYIKV